MKKRALFSLYSLEKAVEFARALSDSGWEIIASQETCAELYPQGIPVTDIAVFTGVKEKFGFPPTLHPKIEAYLTSSRGPRIDLVYILPYPLSVGNDVGGRAILALAAKGKRIPVMEVADMERVIRELKARRRVTAALRESLINKTNALISSHYDDLLKERSVYDLLAGFPSRALLNGENPYQVPAQMFCLKSNDRLSLPNFRQVSGEPPCFTNLADAESVIHTLCLISKAFEARYRKAPHICIAAKHGNPCGAGISWSKPEEAVLKALFSSPHSIWGGEVAVNFGIGEKLSGLLFKSAKRNDLCGNSAWMLDVILAPHFSREAVNLLGLRSGRKLLENKNLFAPFLPEAKYAYRFIRGGFLRQPPNNYVLDFKHAKITGGILAKQEIDSLIIAWAVAWSSALGGNEVALAKDGRLIGAGGGPSTVEAVRVALSRASNNGHNTSKGVFAANAFFPFIDAPQLLAEAGLLAGVVPSGGKQEPKVRNFFRDNGLRMVYLPQEFRGFSRH